MNQDGDKCEVVSESERESLVTRMSERVTVLGRECYQKREVGLSLARSLNTTTSRAPHRS